MAHRFLSFTRWQLALLVGTPIVFGIGLYFYNKKKNDDTENVKQDKSSKHIETSQSVSIDGTSDGKEVEQYTKKVELESDKLSPLTEATMYKNEGNICYRNGKYDEAITFYDKAIEKCPDTHRTDLAIFYQNRAAAYEMLKKWSRVKEDCTLSLEYNPRYAKAYFRRAKAHEATNDIMSCLDDITATCILEMFQNNYTILFADRILKQTGKSDTEKALVNRKATLPSDNFIQSYIKTFTNDPILSASSSDVIDSEQPVRGYARAKKALRDQKYDDIISSCTEEIESSESEAQNKTEALLLRGTFHLLSGNFTEARQDLEAVINNEDTDPVLRATALIKRGALYIQLDERDLCLEDFKLSETILPDNPDVYHQRAQIYMLIDRLPEALNEFEKALKFAPNHAIPYIQRSYCEYRMALLTQDQRRLSLVINDFKNAIEKFPDCVECYSLMAQVLCDQQQFQQADQFYEKAIAISPTNAPLLVHRGIMLLQWRGDISGAVDLINNAIEIDDKCELAYETLGTIEVQRANLQHAVELFEKALKFARSLSEMSHLFALRNAAVAQINVTRKLGIDMSTITALSQSAAPPSAVIQTNGLNGSHK